MGQKQAAALLRIIGVLALVASMSVSAQSVRADDKKADAGNGGGATVEASGGTVTASTVISISADGGIADADATGGDDNVATVLDADESTASAGNGGTAVAEANGGDVLQGAFETDAETGETTFVPGTVESGGNSGGTITVGDTSGDASVIIEGPSLNVTTDVSVSANGGTATADADGGDGNVATVAGVDINQDIGGGIGRFEGTIGDISAEAGNGGTATANANGGNVLIGNIISGNNVGGVITVGNVTGEDGGSALVDIIGGTTTVTTNVNIDANGGNATATAEGGDGNVATVVGVRINQIARGGIGIRTLSIGEISAEAGNGGTANANANGGNVAVGDIVSGNNRGNTIQLGAFEEDEETGELVFVPGTVSGGAGGDATVLIDGGNASFTTNVDISANGGTALADADGGDNNVATLANVRLRQRVGGGIGRAVLTIGDITAAAGNGGTATANANGGNITVGDIVSGDNTGNTITVGDVTGGAEDKDCKCHDGDGDALVDIVGGDVSSSSTITISADGGNATALARGGDGNVALLANVDIIQIVGPILGIVELTSPTPAALAGEGGVATANANGGTIVVGDITTGNNRGNTITVGDVTGGNGGDDDKCKDKDKKDCEPECKKDCEPECKKDCEPECKKDCEPECKKDCEPECKKDCKPDDKDKDGKDKDDDGKSGNGYASSGGSKSSSSSSSSRSSSSRGSSSASNVRALPSTGAGTVAGDSGSNDALLLLGAVVVVAGLGYGLRKRVA